MPLRSVAVAAMAFAFIAVSSSAGELHPDRLTALGSTEPFWVSAASVTTAGAFDVQALPPMARIALQSREAERHARGPASLSESSDCVGIVASSKHVSERGSATWKLLNANADAIYRGTVAEVIPGFFNGTPTAILRITLQDVIRRHVGYPAVDTAVFIDFPATDFSIGGRRFCAQSVRHDDFMPQAGDDVLIFAYAPPTDRSHRYLPTSDEQIFFGRRGRLSIPGALRFDPTLPGATSIKELAAGVAPRDRESRQRSVAVTQRQALTAATRLLSETHREPEEEARHARQLQRASVSQQTMEYANEVNDTGRGG